jgi:Mor family transcriptional regulator
MPSSVRLAEWRGKAALALLNQFSREQYDLLQVVLLMEAARTHLPEILEVLGREHTLKFLEVFAGTTIEVPSREVLERCFRDVEIYYRLSRAKGRAKTDTARDLAAEYDVACKQVWSIYRRMRRVLGAQGMGLVVDDDADPLGEDA